MFERNEREIVKPVMRFQVLDESSQPRRFSIRVRPGLDVFIHAFEHRAAELQSRINFMQRGCPLQIKRRVIFRQHVLAVRLFAYFDIRNGIAPLAQIG